MKTGTKLGLIFGGILLMVGFVVVAGGAAFFLFTMSSGTQRMRELYKKRTAEAEGTITNVSLSSASKIYTFKYLVNGVSYSGTWMTSRNKIENNYEKDVGRKVKVCYDPSDPNSSDFYFSDLNSNGEKINCGGTSK